ncbi:hypothetical protein [Ktedonobacter robiniae]|uniref:Uncharacterized protein n=1 Tax=Ktedonobacter robiniae TaxID=2778365 RepID=A0ABQ3UX21_9CHLR|nr:hypothetical protein [Ktedonobacter robiniae]GHO57240.1 hypothetical protein KSB_57150 [Ktedonobacter robiniae]
MKTIKPCPECGGRRVQTITEIAGDDQWLNPPYIRIKQPERRSNWFKGKLRTSEVSTTTCLDCGYTAVFATNPENLTPDE